MTELFNLPQYLSRWLQQKHFTAHTLSENSSWHCVVKTAVLNSSGSYLLVDSALLSSVYNIRKIPLVTGFCQTFTEQRCEEFTCKLRATVRYCLELVCLENWPVRTVGTNGRKICASLEGDWTERIPPVGTPPVLFINLWAVNRAVMVSLPLWYSDCVRLCSLGWSQFLAYW